ncbi:kinesin-like protein KIF18A [Dermacentor albipictus]|uniref:kinesin-like protein KIF18A n=1 Tax=Dermacentor albipictus TaxID=60249 RepID=UPI0031FD9C5A
MRLVNNPLAPCHCSNCDEEDEVSRARVVVNAPVPDWTIAILYHHARVFDQAGSLNIEALYHRGIYTGAAKPQETLHMETVQSSAPKRRRSDKDPPPCWTQAVHVRLPSDRDSQTASIVCVVITPASMVRPTPATSRYATTQESTMVPPNRRSNGTAQSSGLKRRQSNKDPPSPWARSNVAVRVRLLSDRGSEIASIVRVGDDRCHVFDPRGEAESFQFQEQRTCGVLVKPNEGQGFFFGQFFDETKYNVCAFESTTKDMLTMLIEGCDCSVYTRISTVTSKTFPMLGSKECPGVVSFIASELYQRADKLQSEGQTCDVAVAYLEVYNNVVRDLLYLDPAKTIALLNLTKNKVNDAGTLPQLLLKGNKSRTHHVTDVNAESAWSHAICQRYVALAEYVTSPSKEIRASMCSGDVASLEGAAAACRNIKDQIREGAKLNLSLLSLGNCIDACSKNWTQQGPYQDSKLTHILKDSLGTSSKTLLIGTATALKFSSTGTYNTL